MYPRTCCAPRKLSVCGYCADWCVCVSYRPLDAFRCQIASMKTVVTSLMTSRGACDSFYIDLKTCPKYELSMTAHSAAPRGRVSINCRRSRPT